jgi:hypothetical protein
MSPTETTLSANETPPPNTTEVLEKGIGGFHFENVGRAWIVKMRWCKSLEKAAILALEIAKQIPGDKIPEHNVVPPVMIATTGIEGLTMTRHVAMIVAILPDKPSIGAVYYDRSETSTLGIVSGFNNSIISSPTFDDGNILAQAVIDYLATEKEAPASAEEKKIGRLAVATTPES